MGTHWKFSPAAPTERSAISGAVMGAAAALGYTVTSGGAFRPPAEQRVCTIVLPFDGVARTAGRRCLGLRLCRNDCTVVFDHDDAGRCILRIGSGQLGMAELSRAGGELAGRIQQQAIYHQLVIALRRDEFTIVERTENPQGAVGVLARLPACHQPGSASRTAHPQFSMQVDAHGEVSVNSLRLPREGLLVLDRFLHELLTANSPAPASVETAYPRPLEKMRSAARGHAA